MAKFELHGTISSTYLLEAYKTGLASFPSQFSIFLSLSSFLLLFSYLPWPKPSSFFYSSALTSFFLHCGTLSILLSTSFFFHYLVYNSLSILFLPTIPTYSQALLFLPLSNFSTLFFLSLAEASAQLYSLSYLAEWPSLLSPNFLTHCCCELQGSIPTLPYIGKQKGCFRNTGFPHH